MGFETKSAIVSQPCSETMRQVCRSSLLEVDRAGNVSKEARQSARAFFISPRRRHLPVVGWCTGFTQPEPHSAPARPACRTGASACGLLAPSAMLARAQGLQARILHRPGLRHSTRRAAEYYSQGMDLRNIGQPLPIGMGCKVCERSAYNDAFRT